VFPWASNGSAYARFRRALNTGNQALVLTAAKELPQIGLDDALRICLILREGDPERYERAAVRWLGRFATEARGVTIEALKAAANALDELTERTMGRWSSCRRSAASTACGEDRRPAQASGPKSSVGPVAGSSRST